MEIDLTSYTIFDAANGDELGMLTIATHADDESIIERLVQGGYLDPPADCYLLDDGYMLAENGERVILSADRQPIITLDAKATSYGGTAP